MIYIPLNILTRDFEIVVPYPSNTKQFQSIPLIQKCRN